MDTLETVEDFNKTIKNLKAEREELMIIINRRGVINTYEINRRIDELDKYINKLTVKRSQKVRQAYTHPVIEPTSNLSVPRSKISTRLRPKVDKMSISRNKITIKMTPVWFTSDDQQKALKGIVYPPNTVERRPFDTIARYRMFTDQSNNFCKQPLILSETSTETLILLLDAFAQQFGADLNFSNDNLSVEKSTYHTICGVASLSSAHLLAANYICTAKFSICVQLDYEKSFGESADGVESFVTNFSQGIIQMLNISEAYLRIYFIEKSNSKSNTTVVQFGFTSTNLKETEQIAQDFQVK